MALAAYKARNVLTALLLSASLLLAGNYDGQFLFYDVELEWTSTTFIYSEHLTQPDDWRTPYEYMYGDFYTRLTVIDKPTDLGVRAMFCFWLEGWKHENCTYREQSDLFHNEGVYYHKLANLSAWWVNSGLGSKRIEQGPLDRILHQWWVDGTLKVLRTRDGINCGKNEAWGDEALPHIPIKYRMEFIVVAKGKKLKPPAHWTDVPPEWGANPVALNDNAAAGKIIANKKLNIAQTSAKNYSVKVDIDGAATLVLFSPDGAVAYRRNVDGEKTLNLNLSQKKPGMYLVRLRSADSETAQKLVVY